MGVRTLCASGSSTPLRVPLAGVARHLARFVLCGGALGLAACGGGSGNGSVPNGHGIAGTITSAGVAMPGVTVDLTGAATATTTTAADGTYEFPGLPDGSYTITPSLAGYAFRPNDMTVAASGFVSFEHLETGNGTLGAMPVVSALWTRLDVSSFFEFPATIDGIGWIRARAADEISALNAPLYAEMWATGGTVVVTYFSALGLYTIHLHLHAFPDFGVSADQFIIEGTLTSDSTGNDFVGGPPHTISGKVTSSGVGQPGVTVELTGSVSWTTVTGEDGSYEFAGLVDGSYTILRPSLLHSPESLTVTTTGTVPFEHFSALTGTLDPIAVSGVLWTGSDVSSFFEFPVPPASDGVGWIRAREPGEISESDLALYTDMWTTGGTVIVTYVHALGSDTIDLHLHSFPGIGVSADHFFVEGSLTADSPGNDFVFTPP